MFLKNNALFLYSERSWGIPDDFNELDSQTLEELRAERMYNDCSRDFQVIVPVFSRQLAHLPLY